MLARNVYATASVYSLRDCAIGVFAGGIYSYSLAVQKGKGTALASQKFKRLNKRVCRLALLREETFGNSARRNTVRPQLY